MAALSPEVKAFIVQALACFDTPTMVMGQVKQEFGLSLTIQQVSSYDPTKAIAKNLGQKWVELFNSTRTRFQNEISDIPIANKAYRLRVLDRMTTKAESMKNMALAASLMEQAAKEVGDAYTNKQRVDHTSSDGSMANKPTTIRLVGVEPTNGKPS
ncbi:DUF2280 domain-containing protein [Pectobacterium parmentieri]|uniref:DUF2280 domain-containing protein n=1 Tax=Pectobacterium parmentieri TaxID=1905730 RepID=UPI000F8DF64B|nr:DUF2280 domain-containing protein [Pectobacterium parmentieri]AZS56789.1 hypothetical protein C5E18_11965 [Pectobacterium parmentieri]MBI0431691.1 DUF2280 domain-containing protein [Pectobacterium parmentieri]